MVSAVPVKMYRWMHEFVESSDEAEEPNHADRMMLLQPPTPGLALRRPGLSREWRLRRSSRYPSPPATAAATRARAARCFRARQRCCGHRRGTARAA